MIYALVNTKGGVGKTTNAIQLSTALARRAPTLLIDGDPQESAATWAAWRRETLEAKGLTLKSPTTMCLRGKAVIDEGRILSANFSHTVIDAGGRDNPSLRNAILLAQLAIIPIGASHLDAAAMTDLINLVDVARTFNPDLELSVLLTRIDVRTKDTNELIEFLTEHNLTIFNARIYERVAFRRAIGEGLTVEECGRDAVLAVQDMEKFYQEVFK